MHVCDVCVMLLWCMCVFVCMQAAKQAGRSLEFMKLSNNLAAVQRNKLGKTEAAYEIYQV